MVKRKGFASEADLRLTLAANVRRERDRLGYSRREAAERAGLAESQWVKIEGASVGSTLRTLSLLAKTLEVEPYELLKPPTQ